MSTRDTLLEKKSVEEEHHQCEEIAIKVVASWLHFDGVEYNGGVRLLGSEIAVRLDSIHISGLKLVEEVAH